MIFQKSIIMSGEKWTEVSKNLDFWETSMV